MKLPSKEFISNTLLADLHSVEPLNPVIYTFTGWIQRSDSILLIPPQESESQQPLYRITVHLDLNPFLPLSYITNVFRCGVEDEELVGKFGFVSYSLGRFHILNVIVHRMTCNGAPGLLQIGDTATRRISNVLSNGVSVNFNFLSLSLYLLE